MDRSDLYAGLVIVCVIALVLWGLINLVERQTEFQEATRFTVIQHDDAGEVDHEWRECTNIGVKGFTLTFLDEEGGSHALASRWSVELTSKPTEED